jgi:hypothetical protein
MERFQRFLGRNTFFFTPGVDYDIRKHNLHVMYFVNFCIV